MDAVIALQELFPDKIVKSFELRKSNTDPKENALHLDCCFQPIGSNKAILHKNGFLIEREYQWLVDFFGKEMKRGELDFENETISIDELNTGIYLIQVGEEVRKFVKN